MGVLACYGSADAVTVSVCAIQDDGSLLWVESHDCPNGCQDGLCSARPEDTYDPGDTAEDVFVASDLVETLPDLPNDEGAAEIPDINQPEVCVPDCDGKVCGDDGCFGTCGECSGDEICAPDGAKCCTPECFGKLCGDDGCGGTCGECPEGQECGPYFQCKPKCEPKCEGKECGPNNCAGTCGSCPQGTACGPEGLCSVCVPVCEGKDCGSNGCGGSCGACPYGYVCESFMCIEGCLPICAGKNCGTDLCDGSCGECSPGEICKNGVCTPVCEPKCTGKGCGPDGCGGFCGKCGEYEFCSDAGVCIIDCIPQCAGKVCGDNGCGGKCGTCASGKFCSPLGGCLSSGSPCGTITQQGFCDDDVLMTCIDGKVYAEDCKAHGANVFCDFLPALSAYGCHVEGTCEPDCAGKFCGSNGCTGSCGTCTIGKVCLDGQCVDASDCGDIGIVGCCSGNTVLWCDNGQLWHNDCSSMVNPDQQNCGWKDSPGLYDCVAEPKIGPEAYPYYCEGPCVPSCQGKQCGNDGCGGDCGACPPGLICTNNQCVGENGGCGGYPSDPICQGEIVVWCEDGKVYFDDCQALGPEYHCGWVPDLFVNSCYKEACIPDCEGKMCSDDGCGYVCGYCSSVMTCNDIFQCVYGQGYCGDVDYVGLCVGNSVKWCQNGVLQIFDCYNLGPNWKCDWYDDGDYYWCIEQ